MRERTESGTVTERSGDPGAPSVVLVHGLGMQQAAWQWQRPALEAGFDVITYDLFGHGDSAAPPEEPSLSLLSAQLGGVMDHWGIDRAAVVGFSLGGMIARCFAQDHPDRVTALAILHSPHRRSAAAQQAIVERVETAATDGPAATIEAALERWFTDDFRAANPEMMDRVRGWVLANDRDVYPRLYRVLATGIDEIVAPSPPIAAPTLVITGDEDYGNGPEMSQAIAAEIEGAELLILRGLRHMALAEDPDAINAPLADFLSRCLKGGAA
ncbi:alpha/beta fold hydrolase [Roseovarius spongiae]|uniref:Alpha/beta fold hydrolase n=1 Tax=Roseovarius spongiae TaxID=2320272 RepID=A0A3A8AWM8_9RHOB|nr:alpha/beta hydrolase [Roseovarius spongiae]RKF16798.1 alpha/beta fold hydrolase [Roseovarius spongiae]